MSGTYNFPLPLLTVTAFVGFGHLLLARNCPKSTQKDLFHPASLFPSRLGILDSS